MADVGGAAVPGRLSLAGTEARPTELFSYKRCVQTGNLSLAGADLCIRHGLRAHTQVRPYRIEAFLTSMGATWY